MATRLLVTGGLGFIGSNFIHMALERGYEVVNVDKQTYAARTDLDFDAHPNYKLITADIAGLTELPKGIDYIVNFAAESHVDNSIATNKVFFQSNVLGVHNLLELVRMQRKEERPVFIHISTDEVYGPIKEGVFHEGDRLNPTNPYSASKAAADHIVAAWGNTYGLQYKICRSSNNYGEGQYPEKLFPKTVEYVLGEGKKITVYGDGSFTREWTFVRDNCDAVFLVLEKGAFGEIYNISSHEEYSALDVVRHIIKAAGKEPEEWIAFVEDRPGHDERYSVDTSKIEALGWKPSMTLPKYIPTYIGIYKNKNVKRMV